jgi:hypothetical protein
MPNCWSYSLFSDGPLFVSSIRIPKEYFDPLEFPEFF